MQTRTTVTRAGLALSLLISLSSVAVLANGPSFGRNAHLGSSMTTEEPISQTDEAIPAEEEAR